jgi:hypothetical protein
LAYLLKYRYNVDALAVGHEGNSKDTLRILCEWADLIIIVQPYMKQWIPKRFHSMLSLYNIGEDRWTVLNVELLNLFDGMIRQSIVDQKEKLCRRKSAQ